MKCKNCGKGRPYLWIGGQVFCGEDCFQNWLAKLDVMRIAAYSEVCTILGAVEK